MLNDMKDYQQQKAATSSPSLYKEGLGENTNGPLIILCRINPPTPPLLGESPPHSGGFAEENEATFSKEGHENPGRKLT